MAYNPYQNMPGNYSVVDGTIDFYSRIKNIIKDDMVVLDLGAGRGAWSFDDDVLYRREIRQLKGHVKEVIAVDVDKIVLENVSSDRQLVAVNGEIPLPENSVDLIICDYVFEHIEDPTTFANRINKVLKPGGWLCARTPHKFDYVSVLARIIKNSSHAKVLKSVQPDRKEVDVFPTFYNLNTFTKVRKVFSNYISKSYFFRGDPSYYFGSKYIYSLLKVFHRLLPASMCANMFVFLQKGVD